LVGERQICAFNADRHYSEYREDRGIGRLLRRGRDSVAINAVGSAPYRFPEDRLSTGRYQETEAMIYYPLYHAAI